VFLDGCGMREERIGTLALGIWLVPLCAMYLKMAYLINMIVVKVQAICKMDCGTILWLTAQVATKEDLSYCCFPLALMSVTKMSVQCFHMTKT